MSRELWRRSRAIETVEGLCSKKIEIFYENPNAPELPDKILLLAHPHPLYEGNWHNKLISTMARTAHEYGYATLRPHFSSVGGTPGPFISVSKEVLLIESLLESLAKEIPAQQIAAGFSFGGGVLLGINQPLLPRFLIAPSWKELEQSHTSPISRQRLITIVHALDDLIVPFENSCTLFELFENKKNHHFHQLGCGGHFYQGYEYVIGQLFTIFLEQLNRHKLSNNAPD